MTTPFRRAAAAVLIATACAGSLAGCGDTSSDTATSAGAPTSAPADPAVATDALPEGVYRTAPLTADDIRAAAAAGGFTDAEAAVVTDLFTDSVVWELTLSNGRWVEAEIYDGAPAEVGWEGSYTVDDDHTVTATEDGAGPITYQYHVVGDQLTLSLAPGQSDGGRDNLLHQTVIYQSGPFLRQSATGEEAGAADGAEQTVEGFVAPFTIDLANWLEPTPSQESPTFVTWEASDRSRGLRVMSPVAVYRPGRSETSAPPADMAAYLTSLAAAGAEITDLTDTEVDGLPATEMTIGLGAHAEPGSLDGAIGCPAAGQAPDTCFGPQDDLLLRLAVLDVDGAPVLVWERAARSAADALADGTFDAMLASIRFH